MTQAIEKLTPREIRKLKKTFLGHGNLKRASDITGLHVNTLRIIVYKGYALPETLKTIREKLLEVSNDETKVIAE